MADAALQHQLLLVEDSPSLATVYQEYLRAGPYDIRHAHCIADALKFADQLMPDGVLLDLRLPDGDGLSVLRELRGRDPDLPVVVMTAHGSVALAVEAMQAGASDFLVKPFAPERLTVTVANVMERAALRRQVAVLAAGAPRQGFAGFIGAAPTMQAVYRILENAAASRATVFVTGESGTGKELAAEAVHGISPRKAGPFIAINCAAIPKDLIESEVSAMCAAPLPAQWRTASAQRGQRMAGRYSWMKFAKWIWRCKASCYASSRPARFSPWAAAS